MYKELEKIDCFLLLLQKDIVDVNQIFKDLGMLVHDQGEILGIILCLTVFLFCNNKTLMYFNIKLHG